MKLLRAAALVICAQLIAFSAWPQEDPDPQRSRTPSSPEATASSPEDAPSPEGASSPEGDAPSSEGDVPSPRADVPSPEPQTVFEESIHVKVVNVIAYVRDKKGNPITGLTMDDFELYENGKPVTITNFYEVTGGQRVGDEAPEVVEKPTPEKGGKLLSHPELEPRVSLVPEDERLHLVIYIDNFNIRPFNRNRVFRSLREFLRTKLDREDRVMLVSYNRSLKVMREFTSDPQIISNALYELETHTGGRSQQDSERRDLLRDLDEARSSFEVMGRVRLYAESIFNDLQFTLDALREMTGGLAGIPGRKALLYVSDGLPMRAAEEMFYAVDEKFRDDAAGVLMDSLHYDASRRFMELTSQANASGVIFYAIDAAGLRVNASRSAEYAHSNFSTTIDSVGTQNLQTTLMFMADETGGQAVVNTNNVAGGLERIAHDFDHFYSLGYTPGHGGTGRYHRIEVKVRGKGIVVRHREGYRDKSVSTEMADATLATLNFGYHANPLKIALERNEVLRRDDGFFVVPIQVRIPIGELVLVPGEAYHVARARVWVQAKDDKGVSPVQENSVPIEIPNEDVERAKKQYYVYELPLLMRGGDQRIAVAVRDDLGAVSSFVSRVIRIDG